MKKQTQGLVVAAGLVAVALGGLTLPAAAAPADPTPAPTAAPAGRYLVATDAGAAAEVAGEVRRDGGEVDHVYSAVAPGLAATLTGDQVARLRADEDVTSVTPDAVFHATTTQSGPTWGLDRIDQRGTAGNDRYRYDTTGKGVTVFLVDSGLRRGHHQFGSRARSGTDLVGRDANAADCDGHGTHVAGTVGGSTYGVAKGATLVGVRVLDCKGSGYASDIIKALDWVVAHKPAGPAVVNLSLGGPAVPLLDKAVQRTVARGIPVVVAAGNEDADACQGSPARVPQAITVAATNDRDDRASYSNSGPCVDLFAPGSGIRSASNASDTATEVMSGTSMATPHVTGAVARYLQDHPRSTPAQTVAALTKAATRGAVGRRSGAPDRLLYLAPPATAPGRPTGVSVTTSSRARTATISWTAPTSTGGKAVTGYRLTRDGKDAQGAGALTVTVPASTRQHTFTGLLPSSGYTLTVRAVNAVGAGSSVAKRVPALG